MIWSCCIQSDINIATFETTKSDSEIIVLRNENGIINNSKNNNCKRRKRFLFACFFAVSISFSNGLQRKSIDYQNIYANLVCIVLCRNQKLIGA